MSFFLLPPCTWGQAPAVACHRKALIFSFSSLKETFKTQHQREGRVYSLPCDFSSVNWKKKESKHDYNCRNKKKVDFLEKIAKYQNFCIKSSKSILVVDFELKCPHLLWFQIFLLNCKIYQNCVFAKHFFCSMKLFNSEQKILRQLVIDSLLKRNSTLVKLDELEIYLVIFFLILAKWITTIYTCLFWHGGTRKKEKKNL